MVPSSFSCIGCSLWAVSSIVLTTLGAPRWLLSHISSSLQHIWSMHVKWKSMGYYSGREENSSTRCSLNSANINLASKSNTKDDHVQVCKDINERIHKLIHTKQQMADPATLDTDIIIQSIDAIVWDYVLYRQHKLYAISPPNRWLNRQLWWISRTT